MLKHDRPAKTHAYLAIKFRFHTSISSPFRTCFVAPSGTVRPSFRAPCSCGCLMEGHFLEVPGYSVPGTSYSVPSTNYEVPPTQSVVPATSYEAPGSIMAAMPPGMGGMGGYSAPSTRYDVPGSNDRPVMTYAAPLQSAELTPASTFATTFSSTTNEVPFMKYAAPMDPLHSYGSPVSSFQPPATPEPISTGAFLATHPELATLDGTARALSTPEPLAGYSTPLATTPARCSETPTTLVGATPLIPGFVADAYIYDFP